MKKNYLYKVLLILFNLMDLISTNKSVICILGENNEKLRT